MDRKLAILTTAALIMIIGIFRREPIPQDPLYHQFADQRTVLGIANGWNVLSNALFVFMGAWGIVFVLGLEKIGRDRNLLMQYLLFFAGVFLSGIGSMFYHSSPSNLTLVWDRLPMSIAFMALLASVVSECIDPKAGARLLAPLVALGILSVLYWIGTESAGRGDLRPYALVQFLPVVLVPLIPLLYRPGSKYAAAISTLAAFYLLSKVFEMYDRSVYAYLGFISGHTIKHMLAALGTGAILKVLYGRIEAAGND